VKRATAPIRRRPAGTAFVALLALAASLGAALASSSDTGGFPMRGRKLRISVVLTALAVILSLVPHPGVAAPPSSFTFGAAGDMGVGSAAAATLANLGNAGTDFFLHLGDFSYGGTVRGAGNTPADWCKFVQSKANLPSSYPYELVSGGHVSQASSAQDGPIESYTACLPDRMGSTAAPGSAYGKDYYFDYPQGSPLARVFMIAAGETFANGGTPDSYAAGSPNYSWLSAAIDDARAHGIPWVFVGMAFNCVTAGVKHCEITADLFNLLAAKKVDLILQGHEHGYERSGQFALDPTSCPAIPISSPTGTPSYSATCVADNGSTGNYTKGVGPVVVIAGTAGIGLRPMNQPGSADAPEAPYFAKLMGSTDKAANHGFMKYTVTATQLTATFVSDNDGPTPFTDGFSITGDGGAPLPVGPSPSSPSSTTTTGSAQAGGYWMLGSGGHVYPFGAATDHGNADGTLAPGGRAVHLEPTPSGDGYWIVDTAGDVFGFGNARYIGGAAGSLRPGEQVTSISSTPSGSGYWLFTTLGRVFSFGDAQPLGDLANLKLNGPILDSVPTPSGRGYYMVGSDGGIFAFGDAQFVGSMGGRPLNAPVQSLVPDPDHSGYWLVASDGGVFAFDAAFRGSMGGVKLNAPVTGMVPFGNGYLMVATDGGAFDFSDQPFSGSLVGAGSTEPIVAVAPKAATS
jgi:hypothetical protein